MGHSLLEAIGLPRPRAMQATAPARQPALATADHGDGGDGAPAAGEAAVVDLLQATPGGAAAPANAATPSAGIFPAAYQKPRDAAQKAIDALDAHAQKDRVATERTLAASTLAAADAAAGAGDLKTALQRLKLAVKAIGEARQRADAWATYQQQRRNTLTLLMARKEPGASNAFDAQLAIIAEADALAGKTPPDFAGAVKKLKQTDAKKNKEGLEESVAYAEARLADAKKLPAAARAFVGDNLARAGELVVQCKAAAKAGEWSVVLQTYRAALKLIGPSLRAGEGRAAYDAQRAATMKAVDKVRATAALAARVGPLDTRVAEADELAKLENMKFEAGTARLVEAAAAAQRWLALAATVAAFGKEEPAASAALAALDQHAAAARIAGEREASRNLLLGARSAADAADAVAESGGDPTPGWTLALADVRRAQADLAVDKTLADGLAASLAAEAAATATPPDPVALQQAHAALAADAKKARAGAAAKAAPAQFAACDTQLDAAKKALAAHDDAGAATALAAAARALAEARTIATQHAQFAGGIAKAEAELMQLRALPQAAKIGRSIDAVADAIAAARARDAAHDGPGAMEALRRATDAVPEAKGDAASRAAFDKQAAALAKRIKALKNEALRNRLGEDVAAATLQADDLEFVLARNALKKVEVRLDQQRLEALIDAKNPDTKELRETAARMAANGGGDVVDDLIKAVPDGEDKDGAKARRINALATGRFGVKFTSGKPIDTDGDKKPDGDMVLSIKTCCAVFAKIPQDIRGNRSISKIHHEDDARTGGAHSFDDGEITMTGRPNRKDQQFGAKQLQANPKGGPDVPQLGAVDPECLPANEDPIDFLAHAAAHEVGHGIDDKNLFMNRNGHKDEFGGWISYGASVQPIADVVGPEFGFYDTPEQKQYVLDRLMSKPATPPAVAAGSPEETAKKAFDAWYALATSENVYRRQGDCDKITIASTKRIYHEAYSRSWVSYLASARKKGMTGYQFRAPAEWFAELYACYRSNKLGANHPARVWLEKL